MIYVKGFAKFVVDSICIKAGRNMDMEKISIKKKV